MAMPSSSIASGNASSIALLRLRSLRDSAQDGALQIVDLLLGVVEATLGVRQLRIGVRFLLLVFGEAAVVVGATLFELGAAVLQPSGGVVELLLSRGDLRVGLRAR